MEPDYYAKWISGGELVEVEVFCDQLPATADCFKEFAKAVKEKHDEKPAD